MMMGFVWGVVDGDESSGTADHLGRGHGDSRALWAALIGAGVVGVGTGEVGAFVGHGALAIAAAVGHRVTVIVGAGDAGGTWDAWIAWVAWVQLLAVPLLGMIESRDMRVEICGPELHRRQVHVIYWEVIAREGIVARPAGWERGRDTAVVKLLEAIVESHTHAAVDTQVVVGFISDGAGNGQAGGIGRVLMVWSEVRRLHHGREIQTEVVAAAAALGVSMEGISVTMTVVGMAAMSVPGKAVVVEPEVAVHGGGPPVSGWPTTGWFGPDWNRWITHDEKKRPGGGAELTEGASARVRGVGGVCACCRRLARSRYRSRRRCRSEVWRPALRVSGLEDRLEVGEVMGVVVGGPGAEMSILFCRQ